MKLPMTIVPFFTLRQKVLLLTHDYFVLLYVKLHVKFVLKGIDTRYSRALSIIRIEKAKSFILSIKRRTHCETHTINHKLC